MDLRPLLHHRLAEASERARDAICGLHSIQRESMPRVLAEAVVDVLIATGIGYRDLVMQSHGEHGNSGRKPKGGET